MPIDPTISQAMGGGLAQGLAGPILAALGVFAIFVGILLYLYTAFTYYTIARKLGMAHAWLAWIPIVNMFYIPRIAGHHWAWGFLIIFPPAYIIASFIWNWLIYERRGYPGPLALVAILMFIPFIAPFGMVAHLLIMGIVSWNDRDADTARARAARATATTARTISASRSVRPGRTRTVIDTDIRRRRYN